MTTPAFVLIIIGVLLNAAAQLLLKAGTNAVGPVALDARGLAAAAPRLALEPHILGGLVCYAISVVVWILALSRTEVSVAYPMLSIGYIVNALAAWYLFAEPLTPTRIAGIVVICIGVVLITRS